MDNAHCKLRAEERGTYRNGWIKLTDLPEWDAAAYMGLGPWEDWWPRRVIQAFNAIHGKGAIMLRTSAGNYTTIWVRVWAVQVLMERMAGADAAETGVGMTVADGVALLKAYHDGFRGQEIPEDMKRPDEIAVHLAGRRSIPDWWSLNWFAAWADLPLDNAP